MKKTLTLLLLVFATMVANSQTWEPLGESIYREANVISMAIDNDDVPYIALVDPTDNNSIIVARFNGLYWVDLEATSAISNGQFLTLKIAIAPDDTPYIAFIDANDVPRVMRYDATQYTWEEVGDPIDAIALTVQLAIDPAGVPHVAFGDGFDENRVKVMKFDGTEWQQLGDPELATPTALVTVLEIDSSGVPYVAFLSINDSTASVMKFAGTEWELVGEAAFAGAGTMGFSIAFDSQDTPHLGASGENGSAAWRFNGTSWQMLGGGNLANQGSFGMSLAFDNADILYAAFTNDSRTALRRLNGATWQNVSTEEFIVGQLSAIGLVIDNTGKPYISYQSGFNNLAMVQRFCEECPQITQLDNNSCGISVDFDTVLYAYIVPGADQYRFRVTNDNGVVEVVERNKRTFRLNYLSSYEYDAEYSIQVSARRNGNWGAYGNTCSIYTRFVPPTSLRAESCGINVANFTTNLFATPVALADGYRFLITAEGYEKIIYTDETYFRLNQLDTNLYGITYTVQVASRVGGEWTAYGPTCTVTSPALPLTQLVSSKCGGTVASFDSSVKAEPVLMAQSYRFRITYGGTTEIIDSIDGLFRINQLTSYNYDIAYTVAVAVMINDSWGDYGPACTLSTPSPITSLKEKFCGRTVSHVNTPIYATDLMFADAYRFKVNNGASEQIIETATPVMKINMLAGYAYNVDYTVEVAAYVNGTWGAYGPACTVTAVTFTPVRMNIAGTSEEVALTAYPNPFESAFTLSLETMSDEPVNVQAYDITGKILENRTVAVAELESVRIGENFASGIYSVIVSQGSYTKAVKMVKK